MNERTVLKPKLYICPLKNSNVSEEFESDGRNLLHKRYLLHTRQQVEGEHFEDYYRELQCLFKLCEFKDDSILRDHVVFGIRDGDIREQLLEHDNPSLESVVDICRSGENKPCVYETESLVENGGRSPHSEQQNAITKQQMKFEDKEYLGNARNQIHLDSTEEEVKIEVKHIDDATLQDLFSEICDSNNTRAVDTSDASLKSARSELVDEEVTELRDHDYTKTYIKEASDESTLNTEVTAACDMPSSDGSSMQRHIDNSGSDPIPDNKQFSDTNDFSDSDDTSGIHDFSDTDESSDIDDVLNMNDIDDSLDKKNTLITDHASDTIDTTEANLMIDPVQDNNYIWDIDHQSKIIVTTEADRDADVKIQDTNDTRNKYHYLNKNTTKDAFRKFKGKRNQFRCSVCNIVLFSQKSLLSHELIHNQSNKKISSEKLYMHHRSSQKETDSCLKNNDIPDNSKSTQNSEFAGLHITASEQEKDVDISNTKGELGRVMFMCNVCDKMFGSEASMLSHGLIHAESVTNPSFSDSNDIQQHQDGATSNKRDNYKCGMCKKTFDSQESLDSHVQSYLFTCDVCNRHFNKRCNLKIHLESHTDVTPHVCPVCNRGFKTMKSLINHIGEQCSKRVDLNTLDEGGRKYIEEVLDVFRQQFKCNTCKMIFRSQKNLDSHMQAHSLSLTCQTCDRQFKKFREYRIHLREHTAGIPYICIPRQFKKKTLNEHMYSHNKEGLYVCHICTKPYKYKYRLIEHLLVHTDPKTPKVKLINKEHQCHFCSKMLSTQHGLINHIRIHTKERPFKCNICNKSFITKYYLKVHARVHTGETPFCCDQCGLKFKMKQNFTNHILCMHRNERNHKCTLCKKSYPVKYKLNAHMLNHTRPFKCNMCNMAFPKKNKLQEHLLTHRKN